MFFYLKYKNKSILVLVLYKTSLIGNRYKTSVIGNRET